VTKKQPEWWSAVNGKTRRLNEFKQDQGKTTVPLTLEPYESGFVVFQENIDQKDEGNGRNFPEKETLKELNNSWDVTFNDPNETVSETVTFDSLQDWTDHSEEEIKFF